MSSFIRKALAFMGIALLVLLALTAALAVGLMNGVSELAALGGGPAVIHIDEETFTLGELGFSHALVVALALLCALLVVMVVVPVALGMATLAVAVALLAAVALPALALGLVVVLLCSPVLLLGAVLWLLLRPRKTTIAA